MLFIAIILGIVLGDQLIKQYILNTLEFGESRQFIPAVLQLTHTSNAGVAFGFLQGQPWIPMVLNPIVLIGVVILMVRGIIADRWQRWAMTAVVAGGAGNLIDRFVHGFVVDMFEFSFVRFAIFNLADVFITLGVIAFGFALVFEELRRRRAQGSEPSHE